MAMSVAMQPVNPSTTTKSLSQCRAEAPDAPGINVDQIHSFLPIDIILLSLVPSPSPDANYVASPTSHSGRMSPHPALRALPLVLVKPLLLRELAIHKPIPAIHVTVSPALRRLRIVACARVRPAHHIVVGRLVGEGIGVIQRLGVGRGVDERLGRDGGRRRGVEARLLLYTG